MDLIKLTYAIFEHSIIYLLVSPYIFENKGKKIDC